MKNNLYFLFLIIIFSLLSCSGITVPNDKKDIVGIWRAPGVILEISESGGVNFKKSSSSGSFSLSAPLKEISDTEFTVGVLFFKKKFIINKMPYKDREYIKMIVDSIELTKVPY